MTLFTRIILEAISTDDGSNAERIHAIARRRPGRLASKAAKAHCMAVRLRLAGWIAHAQRMERHVDEVLSRYGL